jgi:hypothetical protein
MKTKAAGVIVLNYSLTGSGWAQCEIQIGEEKVTVTASYLTDALKHLIEALIHVSTKSLTEARTSFDEEPGEYRWVLTSDDQGTVHVKILEFQGLWSNDADSLGKQIFSATCTATELLNAAHSMCNELLEKDGLAGYEKKWANASFPIELYRRLCEITGKPVSDLVGKKYENKNNRTRRLTR